MTFVSVFGLLIAFQIKHFAADFLLQTSYMMGKFKAEGWMRPLGAHCLVHLVFTFTISFGFLYLKDPSDLGANLAFSYLLSVFDFWVHFTMDRIKASPSLMGRWKALSGKEYQELAPIAAREVYGLGINDALKAEKKIRGNTYFWWAIGFDQLTHHITHYAIIAALLLSTK